MFLKVGIKNIEHERRELKIETCGIVETNNPEIVAAIFKTYDSHRLSVGDRVFFSESFVTAGTYLHMTQNLENYIDGEVVEVLSGITHNSVVYDPGYYLREGNNVRHATEKEVNTAFDNKCSNFLDELTIVPFDFTPNTFRVNFKRYRPLLVKEVIDTDELTYIYPYNRFPFKFKEGETVTIIEKTVDVNNNVVYHEITGCTFINNLAFTSPLGLVSESGTYFIEDNRFFTDEGLKNGVTVYEYKEMFNLNVPISNSAQFGVNHEDIITKYFDEKRKSLIPSVIDYEKRCFTPINYYLNAKHYVRSIGFNLFFRDRSGSEEWMTSDKQGWNQYKMDDDGNFPSTTTQKNGDLIGVLNFTDEDIVYRKKKVSKSFLRLSFYDSPNPETQMLLYYSTIFFDMNDLYAKYMNLNALVGNTDNNGRTENNLGTKNLVNYNDNDTYRLGVNFRVYDRFEKGKSSDGFYLYLFPDDLEEGKTKTIYMKVEFNHAGYGRTIPFIFARSGNNFYNFDDAGFPQTFDGKWDECNQAQYLPIKIQYDNTLKDYIYQFIYRPQNDRNITFNLYEPRLNSLV